MSTSVERAGKVVAELDNAIASIRGARLALNRAQDVMGGRGEQAHLNSIQEEIGALSLVLKSILLQQHSWTGFLEARKRR